MTHQASPLYGVDLENLTPKQLRQMLRGDFMASMLRGKRSKSPLVNDDDEDDQDEKANDDLVALDRERGDSRPPKIQADDLPNGVTMPPAEEQPKKKKEK